jgi:hypothetical protein
MERRQANCLSLTGERTTRTFFAQIGSKLPSVARQLGQHRGGSITGNHAEVVVVRATADGSTALIIHVIRGADGIWRVESMQGEFMKITIRHATWVGGLAILFVLYSVYAAQGTVIDGSTGKPMAGVHIVAAWHGSMSLAVQPSTRCYHAEATVTDERGRFSLSTFSGTWNPLIWDRTRSMWALAPGYVTSDKSDYGSLDLVLVPATGAKAEQFKSLPRPAALGCPSDRKLLLPFWRALYKEALRLASTPEERRYASGRLFDIEEIELGEEEAFRRLNHRSVQENLEGRP